MDAQLEPRPTMPPVVQWYRYYCGFLLVLFLVVAPALMAAGIALERNPAEEMISVGSAPEASPADKMLRDMARSFREQQNQKAQAAALWIFIVGAVVAVPVGIALTLSPTPGSWIYHIVIICLGLSGCTLPLSVILLIHWFRPETQAYFGRGTPNPTPSSTV